MHLAIDLYPVKELLTERFSLAKQDWNLSKTKIQPEIYAMVYDF